jgi:hypothetical protein
LEAACPVYSKEIVCLLTEKALRGKIKKVEKILRTKSKKNVVTKKVV